METVIGSDSDSDDGQNQTNWSSIFDTVIGSDSDSEEAIQHGFRSAFDLGIGSDSDPDEEAEIQGRSAIDQIIGSDSDAGQIQYSSVLDRIIGSDSDDDETPQIEYYSALNQIIGSDSDNDSGPVTWVEDVIGSDSESDAAENTISRLLMQRTAAYTMRSLSNSPLLSNPISNSLSSTNILGRESNSSSSHSSPHQPPSTFLPIIGSSSDLSRSPSGSPPPMVMAVLDISSSDTDEPMSNTPRAPPPVAFDTSRASDRVAESSAHEEEPARSLPQTMLESSPLASRVGPLVAMSRKLPPPVLQNIETVSESDESDSGSDASMSL